jgi:hypothetical protein
MDKTVWHSAMRIPGLYLAPAEVNITSPETPPTLPSSSSQLPTDMSVEEKPSSRFRDRIRTLCKRKEEIEKPKRCINKKGDAQTKGLGNWVKGVGIVILAIAGRLGGKWLGQWLSSNNSPFLNNIVLILIALIVLIYFILWIIKRLST